MVRSCGPATSNSGNGSTLGYFSTRRTVRLPRFTRNTLASIYRRCRRSRMGSARVRTFLTRVEVGRSTMRPRSATTRHSTSASEADVGRKLRPYDVLYVGQLLVAYIPAIV